MSTTAAWLTLIAGLVLAAVGIGSPGYAAAVPVAAVPMATPGFDGPVQAVAYLGDTVYVGGGFHNAVRDGVKTPRAGLAALDSRTGALLAWAPRPDGSVLALATDPATGTVYLAGGFRHIGGVARDQVAAVTAATGALGGFAHTITGTARVLAVGAGRLYLAGTVSAVDGRPAANLVAFRLADGAVDAGFTAGTDKRVNALALAGTRLYLGGGFRHVNGAGTGRLAAVDPATGRLDPSFAAAPVAEVLGLAAGPGAVYAAIGGSGGRASGYGPSGTHLWTETTDGDAQAIGYLAGVVYLGGHFDHACTSANVASVGGACLDGSVPRGKLLAVDATSGALLAWNPAANGVVGVSALAVRPSGGALAAGGTWTTLAGLRQPRFAQFVG